MGDDATTPPYRRAHPWRFWIGTGLATVGIAITAYLGTMTVLWGLRVDDLREVNADLSSLKRDLRDTVSEQEGELAQVQESLTDTLTGVSDLAHTKARAEDEQFVYRDFVLAFQDCAAERSEVLYYVQTRYTERWVIWQVHAYDDDVNAYCDEVKQAWAEALAEVES